MEFFIHVIFDAQLLLNLSPFERKRSNSIVAKWIFVSSFVIGMASTVHFDKQLPIELETEFLPIY